MLANQSLSLLTVLGFYSESELPTQEEYRSKPWTFQNHQLLEWLKNRMCPS